MLRKLRSPFVLGAVLLLTIGVVRADSTIDLARYRGSVVVLDFWASWCGPCRQSFPWLNSIAEKYRNRGVIVVGVNVDRERSDADRFLQTVPASFPIIYDPTGSLAARYQVEGMPSSFILSPDGKVIAKHVGFKSSAREEREAELERALSSLPRSSVSGVTQ